MENKQENKFSEPKSKFTSQVEELSSSQDLLLLMVMVTNIPIIEAEFGDELAEEALLQVETNLSRLSPIASVQRVSKAIFGLRAFDSSNPVNFIRQVKSEISSINISGKYRFLLEVSIGAVLTEQLSNLSAGDWLGRLNLALMKSTRTGQVELADHNVATSEQVRHELARLAPGSPPPQGMYWVFQPINYVSTGALFGYEALCRWDIPNVGSVSPEVFIQIAEDMNLVQIIDFWTLKAVERSYAELITRGAQAISINISAQTLGNDHEFFTAVDLMLPKIQEAHCSLIFELTETSVIQNQLELSLGLIGLRQRGAKIAIDDFGTGKTSLSVISSLPTDFVKLDGSLLQAERPDLSRGLLELGIKFADLVSAEVIVEKVETQADLDLARQVGAQYAQGWLFGQPVDLRPSSTPLN
jgi:EAL domain-containing protein (putative c-di-GMP-specific phosphodiesterase class I)